MWGLHEVDHEESAMAVWRPDPALQRRRLRSELRKAREAAGYTQTEVAAAMDWSASKLTRIEAGQVTVSTTDLRALLAHYGINDRTEIERLEEIARASRERSWWSGYRELVSPEFMTYLGYEYSASIMRTFQPQGVPGLLQTEEYARVVIGEVIGQDRRRVDALVELRMARQEVLERDDPLHLHCILDEAVIRRVVGSPALMRRQLRHLKEAADRPNVTVRVMPFSRGWYSRMRSAYILLEFPDVIVENVLFIETEHDNLVIREETPEKDEAVTPGGYIDAFFQKEQMAPTSESLSLIDDALGSLSRSAEEEPDNE
jgi:transcriptional regulator with XRE-family HTH domain